MVMPYDPSQTGGAQEHLYFLSRALNKLGHKVDIYGPTGKGYKYKNYYNISKPLFVSIGGNAFNLTTELNQSKKLILSMDKKKYHLLHFHDYHIPFVNSEIIKNVKIPKVASFHSAWDDNSFFNTFLPIMALFKDDFSKHFSGSIYVSKLSQARWKNLSKRGLSSAMIYNGVDKVFTPAKKKKNSAPTILFLSRLVTRKGGKYLVRAMKKVVEAIPNVKLTIVGKGPVKKTLMDYVRNNKLRKNVIFAGEIFGNKKIKYYQEADIFCAPYTNEAFGLTMIEAMACGVPVVGFKNSATKEIFKDCPDKEFFVEPKDTNGLADSLIELLTNDKRRKNLSRWCLKESKKYSWAKAAEETEKFYYRVLNKI